MPTEQWPTIYVYYDSETNGLTAENRNFIFAYALIVYPSGKEEEKWFTDPLLVRPFLHSLSADNGINVICLAHNGWNYDYFHMFSADEIKQADKIARKGKVLALTEETDLSKVQYQDTVLLFSTSISKLGDGFKMPKGLTPAEMMNGTYFKVFGKHTDIEKYPQAHRNYCILDVKIMRYAYEQLKVEYNSWNKSYTTWKLPITSASMAYRTWCYNYWPKGWDWERKMTDNAKEKSFIIHTPKDMELTKIKITSKRYDSTTKEYHIEIDEIDSAMVSALKYNNRNCKAKGKIFKNAKTNKWTWNGSFTLKVEIDLVGYAPNATMTVDYKGQVKISIKKHGVGKYAEGTAVLKKKVEDYKVAAETIYSAVCKDKFNEGASKAYYGGMVLGNPDHYGKEVEQVQSWDRNAQFPTEMKEHLFPDMQGGLNQGKPTIGSVLRCQKKGYGFWGEFTLCPPADTWTGSRETVYWPERSQGFALNYLTGKTVRGFYASPIINYAMENGWYVQKVHSIQYAKVMKPFFKEFVNHFWNLRSEHQLAGREGQAMCVKIIMNSLYGRFGMKNSTKRIESDIDIDAIIDGNFGDDADWRLLYDIKFYKSKDEASLYLVEKEPSEKSDSTWFGFSAFITANANVSLMKAINACGDDFLYSDTDSVHTKDGFIPKLEMGSGLGQWKPEQNKPIPKAIYWEAKAYTHLNADGSLMLAKHKGVSNSNGNLREPQEKMFLSKPSSSLRKGLELGTPIRMTSHSARYCTCWPCNRGKYLKLRQKLTIKEVTA